jgi:hypothetical protein
VLPLRYQLPLIYDSYSQRHTLLGSSLALMSIPGVAFTVTDGTMYFIFYLVEITRTIHIIAITRLHIIHHITEMLLLLSLLTDLSHGHI